MTPDQIANILRGAKYYAEGGLAMNLTDYIDSLIQSAVTAAVAEAYKDAANVVKRMAAHYKKNGPIYMNDYEGLEDAEKRIRARTKGATNPTGDSHG